MPKTLYTLYVVELTKRVFTANAKFRKTNPHYHGVLQCLYDKPPPKERFMQHKTGHKYKKGYKIASKIVETYGTHLRPSLNNHIDPFFTRIEALKAEEQIALELRRAGYAVWSN